MKKILLALLASTAVGGVALAQDFPDVPAGSYAEEAVARLADLGIVIGFPDGTFRGNEAFTRYQAALLATRLLDTVEAEMLTDADLDTLRNAVQELASDVAANEQAVSDLQTAIDSSAGADPAAIEQLQSQLDALTVQLDTLTANAGAGLEQQVQENTDQISQLNELLRILNEDVAAIGTGTETDPSFLGDIEQNTSDIANLREFVVLLRRDQVGLTDRVATLEETDSAQTARLDDVETRLTALEEAQVAFGGSIGLEYNVGRLSGAEDPFDVDRLFGVGLERELDPSVFSTGNEDQDDDGDDADDAGEVAQDRQDIENDKGEFGPVLELNVDFSSEAGLSPESGLNSFESTVVLQLSEATVLDADVDVTDPEFDFTDDENYFDAYVFEFTGVTATLGPIGADPINFYYGGEPGAEGSDYVFESLGSGFRVDIGTPDFLAFLQPTLQLAYGVYEQGGDDSDDTLELPDDDADVLASGDDGATATAVANPFTDAYYRGISGTLTPFSGEGFSATGGFTVGQIAGNAAENADAAGNNADITAYSLDGDVNLSIFNLTFEYAANQIDDNVVFQNNNDVLEDDDGNDLAIGGTPLPEDEDAIPVAAAAVDNSVVTVAEVTVDTEAAGIPLLRSLGANYRNVPEFWYGLKYDEDTYPWETDQVGYGVDATAGLSIFNLTGFYDSYAIANDVTEGGLTEGSEVTGNEVAAYGVDLGAELYRAVEVYGFYNYVTLDGQAVEGLEEADRNDEYDAGFGVGLRHDGDAENALLPGLNFDVAYNIQQQAITAANVDTEVTVGVFTLAPFADFSVNQSNLEFSDDSVELEAGASLTTEPLDVLLQPSLAANVNYRNTDHTDIAADTLPYTTDVLQYSVGIDFNQFLFENSTLGVRYGSFSGTNLSVEPNTTDSEDDDFASDISDDDAPGTGIQTTNGYEIAWDYYGLEFGYGVYFNTNPAASPNPGLTAGQAFSISYTVNF